MTGIVLAMKSGDGVSSKAPRKFQLEIRFDEKDEWATLMEVKSLNWDSDRGLQFDQWKFWLLPMKKPFREFRLKMPSVEELAVTITTIQLYAEMEA